MGAEELRSVLKDFVASQSREPETSPNQEPKSATPSSLPKHEEGQSTNNAHPSTPLFVPSVQHSSPCSKFTKALLQVAEHLSKVVTAEAESQSWKEKAEAIVEGLIGGLEMASVGNPRETTRYQRHFPVLGSEPPTERVTSWRDVTKRGNLSSSPGNGQASQPASYAKKVEVRKKLLDLAGLTPDPARQGNWEPEMDNFRKMDIPELQFKKEVEDFLREEFEIENGIQTCRRLERGGFRLQLTTPALTSLSERPDMKIVTAQHGTWTKTEVKDPNLLFPSIVAEGIDQRINGDTILNELAVGNFAVHGKSERHVREAVKKIERLKRRNKDTGLLEPTRSVRIYGDRDLLDELLKHEGFIIGSRPIFCRPYTKPLYTCFQCLRVGHHRFSECRFPPKCKHCRGQHLSTNCSHRSKDEPQGTQPADWEDLVSEEERSKKKNLGGPPIEQQ